MISFNMQGIEDAKKTRHLAAAHTRLSGLGQESVDDYSEGAVRRDSDCGERLLDFAGALSLAKVAMPSGLCALDG